MFVIHLLIMKLCAPQVISYFNTWGFLGVGYQVKEVILQVKFERNLPLTKTITSLHVIVVKSI